MEIFGVYSINEEKINKAREEHNTYLKELGLKII